MLDQAANDDNALTLADGELLVAEIRRLTAEVARLEALSGSLEQLAHTDPLVELPNRRGFLASLENLIARVERYGEPAAMLFIDVDSMKQINDRLGHEAGDAALVQVARTIAGCIRKSDCVARIGGDEFGVLLERSTELSGWQMALRIVESIVASKFCFNGSCLPLSVAVGVGIVKAGDTPASIMGRADEQMYRVKAA
jgi:diguanylate cyclase (GGDEF)-like protein